MARRTPGITNLADGRILVRVTARCPFTGVKKHRKRVFDAGTAWEDLVIERAGMSKDLKAELAETERKEVQKKERIETTTVADYAEQWLKTRSLKPSTREKYINTLSAHVLPFLGEKLLRDVGRMEVQDWVVSMERRTKEDGSPYSEHSMMGWFRMLTTILRDATADFDLPDPLRRVQPPRSSVKAVRSKETLTAAQLGLLVDTALQHFPEWHPEIYVLAYSGMRPGELYALEWRDVDPDQGCIHIERAVWKDQVSSTKTDSPRVVAMPPEMYSVLTEHRLRLLRAQHPGVASGLIFPAENGKHRFPTALAKTLATIVGVGDLPVKVTPQVLRRTFNTLLVEAGVSPIVLRAQMGHSSEAMTERYAGVHIEPKAELVKTLLKMTQKRKA